MKNLGGISIDFVGHETENQTEVAIGIKLKGVPRETVAKGVLGLILGLMKANPDFIDDLQECAEKVLGDEEEDGEWKD